MFPSLGIKEYVMGGVIAIVLASYGVLGFEVHHWHSSATNLTTELNQQIANNKQLVLDYTTAAKIAKAQDDANLNRVKVEAAQQNERTDNEYQARVNNLNVELARLRSQSRSTSNPGSPPTAPVPGVPTSPVSVDPKSCSNELLTLDCRFIASKQAVQLDELIKWVNSIHSVNVNGDNK